MEGRNGRRESCVTTMHMKSLAVAALLVLCLALAACGSESTQTQSEDTEPSPTAVPHEEPTSPPAQASGSVSLSSGDAAAALSPDVVVSGTLSAEPAVAAMSANNATRRSWRQGLRRPASATRGNGRVRSRSIARTRRMTRTWRSCGGSLPSTTLGPAWSMPSSRFWSCHDFYRAP